MTVAINYKYLLLQHFCFTLYKLNVRSIADQRFTFQAVWSAIEAHVNENVNT